MAGLIKDYKELKKKVESLKNKIPQPPFHGCYNAFYVDELGNLGQKNSEMFLCPEEALRLGRWLVKFYEGVDEE